MVQVEDEAALVALFEAWQDSGSGVPGYLGGRLLRFRDKPGRYVIQADFDSWESAQANNDRTDTREWGARLAALLSGEPKYEDLDVLTGF